MWRLSRQHVDQAREPRLQVVPPQRDEPEGPLGLGARHAGLEGSVVVNDVRKAKKGQGLNAATGQIVDLVAEGIIDPAMVTRSALQNAASIAKNILTTEAIVAEVPEKDGGGGMGGGMPDMSGMM